MRVFSSRATLACYLMLLAGYVGGALVPLMDSDPAQHAAIALTIHATGDWTQLITQGREYPGTPHLLFWLTALAFKFLGVNDFACKLPALLFSLLAVYSTTRLGARLYSDSVGRLAGVILASTFAFLLANNDVRTDALLTGSTIFAIWQLIAFVSHNGDNELKRRQHLSLGSFGLALGFASQGMIGIILPLIAVLLYLVYLCDWRRLLDRGWLLLPLHVLLYTSPVLYAYFHQFGTEGLEYILWSQGIEQMSGIQSGLAGAKSPLFFHYTFLWAFLPWSLLALWSMLASVKQLFNDRFWPRARGNALTLGTLVVMCTLITVSKFRLHYLCTLLPLFAIQLAGWLPTRLTHPKNRLLLWGVQSIVFVLMAVLALMLHGWFFPLLDWQIIGMAAVVLLFGLGFLHRWSPGVRLIKVTVCLTATFYLLLNFNFYPRLLTYQAGTTLGDKVHALHIPPESLHYLENGGRASSFDIITARLTPTLSFEALSKITTPTVLYVSAEGRESIETKGFAIDMLAYSPDYPLSRLSMKFLDPNTRARELRPVYLLRVRPQAAVEAKPAAAKTEAVKPPPARPRPAPQNPAPPPPYPQAPVPQAPVSQAPASQAPASQAPYPQSPAPQSPVPQSPESQAPAPAPQNPIPPDLIPPNPVQQNPNAAVPNQP